MKGQISVPPCHFLNGLWRLCAIAVKKGNTQLLDKINGALAELKSSGTLDEIVAKYITAE